MDDISFRLITPADLPALHEWLSRPHVAEWWNGVPSIDQVAEEFGRNPDESGTHFYFALQGSEPIGFIQWYVVMGSGGGWWPDEQDPGVRGIDQFLAHESQLGQGLGTRMVRAFVQTLFEDPRVTCVQTDPSPANARAIRCYEKAGFRPDGVVDTPDGPALLMYCERPAPQP